MTEEELQRGLRLMEIFMPFAVKQRSKAFAFQNSRCRGDPLQFAHQTSAEAALSIMRGKSIWLRNATCMACA